MLLLPPHASSRGGNPAGVALAYAADSDEEYRRSPPPPYELVLAEEGAARGPIATRGVWVLEVCCTYMSNDPLHAYCACNSPRPFQSPQ